MVNDTLRDLMEVYRLEVSRLEGELRVTRSDLDVAQSDYALLSSRYRSLESERDDIKDQRDNAAATVKEYRAKFVKQDDVIDSLHIELQNTREELTKLKDVGG